MEIDKKLYEDIKAYCDLNGIKPKEYINTLLKKAFMEDKYGAAPFRTYKEENGDVSFNNIPENVLKAKMKEILDDMVSGNKEYAEFVDKMGADEYNKAVEECIFSDNVAKNDDLLDKTEDRDTDRDNVSRNDKTETKNGEFSDKTETKAGESRQVASNVASKPKKRTINVK